MATALENVEYIYSYLFLLVAKIDQILYNTRRFSRNMYFIHERINIPSAFKHKKHEIRMKTECTQLNGINS